MMLTKKRMIKKFVKSYLYRRIYKVLYKKISSIKRRCRIPHSFFVSVKRGVALVLITFIFLSEPHLLYAVDASVSAVIDQSKQSTTSATPTLPPFDPKEASPSSLPLPLLDTQAATVAGAATSSSTLTPTDMQTEDSFDQQSAQKFSHVNVKRLSKKSYQSKEKLSVQLPGARSRFFKVSIRRQGAPEDLPVAVSRDDTTNEVDLTITPPLTIIPGKYTITVTDERGVAYQDQFVWGLLAINPEKSIYHTGEEVKLAMAVLNEKGEMVCDAKLTLSVSGPNGSFSLTTVDGQIKTSEHCTKKTFSLEPDYATSFNVESEGTYKLTLTGVVKQNDYTITDQILVQNNVAFDVSRLSATRLYPPLTYPMIMTVTAKQDFSGVITEVVPDSFDISNPDPKEYPDAIGYDKIEIVTPQQSGNVLGADMVNIRLPFDPPDQPYTPPSDSGTGAPSQSTVLSASTSTTATDSGTQIQTLEDSHASSSALLGAQAVKQALEQSEQTASQIAAEQYKNVGYPITYGFGEPPPNQVIADYYKKYMLLAHDGIDFAMPIGTPIKAADDGQVIVALANYDYGTTVILDHSWGRTYYGHLSKLLVSSGEEVKKGDIIGLSGLTGFTTGPHLHFGMKFPDGDPRNGYKGKVDPAPYLGLSQSPSPVANLKRNDRIKVLTFRVTLKKGETRKFGYMYKTPPQSPRLYRVGPARFFDEQNNLLFAEARQWQLAIDGNYSGKQMHTVEYILGGGTDNTGRGDGVLAYAGTSWNTTKASAGTLSLVLDGTGIDIKNAYVEVDYNYFATPTPRRVNYSFIFMDVANGPAAGTDVQVDQEAGQRPSESSGTVSTNFHQTANITAMFDRQTDGQFNAGISIVGSLRVDFNNTATRYLSNMKLVITYEDDYSTTSHNETKTVRFPLDSTNGTDTGTRQAACAASTTCSFSYTADIPDATADADIMDVWFEVTAEVNSATASTFTPQINGGGAGTAFAWGETGTDDPTVKVYYSPAIGNPNFRRSTAQTLDVVNGTVNLQALGGELVVTYRYSTGAATQTDTVRYFMDQDTTTNGTTKTAFTTKSVAISNTGLSVKEIWYKVMAPRTESETLTVYGTVGGGTEKSNAYTLGGANSIRTSLTPMIYYSMKADIGQFTSSPTNIAGATQWSSATGDAPVSTELYVTFTWSGSSGGTQTKSLLFSEGLPATTNTTTASMGTTGPSGWYNNRAFWVYLTERVNKTYRDAYIQTTFNHSQSTNINIGTVTIGVDGTTTAITENGEEGATTTPEAFAATYQHEVSSTIFSGGSPIDWTRRAFEVHHSLNQSDESLWSTVMVVTYDAEYGQQVNIPDALGKQVRTIEYILGNGSDNTARGGGTTVYAGTSWNTVKANAGTKTITIQGTSIRVVNAYMELSGSTDGTTSVNNVDTYMDVANGPAAGTDVRVNVDYGSLHARNSGLTLFWRQVNDVSALFDRQTDAQFNAGIAVVAGYNAELSAANNLRLTTMKLVITYEQDFSALPHAETKTVRFPLDSTNGTDTGTRQATCAASTTCSFSYTANIPDAVADADVYDAWFDVSAQVNSATASTFTPQINGGTAGTAFAWGETNADITNVRVAYRPPIGNPDFRRSTAQQLDIVNGTVILRALGGELVVTYKYQTDAASQTETINYFMNQRTTDPSTTKNTFSQSIYLSNPGYSIDSIWYKVNTADSITGNFTVFGTVGAASEKSNVYALSGTNARAAADDIIYYSMAADKASYTASPTTIAGATQYSVAGGSAPAVQLFITFTWNGSTAGSITKTVKYGASQGGNHDGATQANVTSLTVTLPEQVTKTYRSSYIYSSINHTDGTNITLATVTIAVDGTSTVNNTSVVETGDTESFCWWMLHSIPNTIFSNGATIAWTENKYLLQNYHNQANLAMYGMEMDITYDVDYSTFGTYENPTLSQLMRHGKWFNSFGVEQAFSL